MPCLNLSTNVNLEGVDTSAILSEATSIVAKLVGKPEAVCIHLFAHIFFFFFRAFLLLHHSSFALWVSILRALILNFRFISNILVIK